MPTNTKHIQSEPERVLIDSRPHIAFVFTQMWRWVLIGLLVWGGLRWVGMLRDLPVLVYASNGALLVVGSRMLLGFFDWVGRRHILTEQSICASRGVLRRVQVEIPLGRVQHTIMVRPAAERLMGIGSIGVTSAGTGGVDLVWRGVEHPQRVLDTIKAQVQRMSTNPAIPSPPQRTPVIGLVGGIGSGKSTVAEVFASLGCVVSDSDQQVRELMREPSVISRLREWWGDDVVDQDGQIDRSRVAQIVFEKPFERRKLEGLIHPMVHEHRKACIEQAIEDGSAGVIIDAPLLFEAGVDGECDAIVYVDTPHPVRVARVAKSRGWSEKELDRREKAQLGLEEKRKRSDYVVANSGLPEELHRRVARVLGAIQKDLRERSANA